MPGMYGVITLWSSISKSGCYSNAVDDWCIMNHFIVWVVCLVNIEVKTLIPVSDDLSVVSITWWRHQMNVFSALQTICAGNSPVTGEFPAQRPVPRSFDGFFIYTWINGVNNGVAGELRRHRTHYDVTVMQRSNVSGKYFMSCMVSSSPESHQNCLIIAISSFMSHKCFIYCLDTAVQCIS